MQLYKDVVCTFCGCLCDDLEVEVEDNAVVGVKKACAIGKNKLFHDSRPDSPPASIAGREVSIEEAIDEAAHILARARYPLIYGLSSTTSEAQRELVAIAEKTRGTIDNPSSY
jgi:formylmethanofuran dehydrogenase subunit B